MTQDGTLYIVRYMEAVGNATKYCNIVATSIYEVATWISIEHPTWDVIQIDKGDAVVVL